MFFRMLLFVILTFLISAASFTAFGQTDDQIRKILADRIDRDHRSVGIVVGIVDAKGRRVISHGALAMGDSRVLNGDTIFEIGSITKVFTSLLLMDMVRKHEVALTDPVAKYLPPNVRVPERNGRKITLADLSTQTSGLPRLPSNFTPKDPANPYVDYTVEQLYKFLAGYELTREIGEKYEYSNLGVALLGHALALRAGMSYESLVKSRIAGPLGMASTTIALTPEMKLRFATGYDGQLRPVSPWDIPTLAGAGALRSTTNDMLSFVAANLGYTRTPLAAAMADEISIRKPTGQPGLEIAYGWHVITANGKSMIWHNGGTGGFRTFLGFDPKTRVGVVVLSNASTPEGADDIGRHLLNRDLPLATFEAKEHKAIPIDPKRLDLYTGQYQMAPNFTLSITRESDRLYAQATGQGKFEIFPEAETEFFAKVANIQISFSPGPGKSKQLVVHQGGLNTPAPRVD